jgi:hypothetical protein
VRRSTLACGLLLAFIGLFPAATAVAASRTVAGSSAARRAVDFYAHQIRKLRAETWYWQRVMGVRRRRAHGRTLERRSVTELRHAARAWRRHEKRAFRHAHRPPHLGAFLCIHRFEGSWSDAGAPYWGGLQMDISFQRTYGGWLLRRKGTADHWTPLEQIWTAVRAARARGFYPWPNTARSCGLF